MPFLPGFSAAKHGNKRFWSYLQAKISPPDLSSLLYYLDLIVLLLSCILDIIIFPVFSIQCQNYPHRNLVGCVLEKGLISSTLQKVLGTCWEIIAQVRAWCKGYFQIPHIASLHFVVRFSQNPKEFKFTSFSICPFFCRTPSEC